MHGLVGINGIIERSTSNEKWSEERRGEGSKRGGGWGEKGWWLVTMPRWWWTGDNDFIVSWTGRGRRVRETIDSIIRVFLPGTRWYRRRIKCEQPTRREEKEKKRGTRINVPFANDPGASLGTASRLRLPVEDLSSASSSQHGESGTWQGTPPPGFCRVLPFCRLNTYQRPPAFGGSRSRSSRVQNFEKPKRWIAWSVIVGCLLAF